MELNDTELKDADNSIEEFSLDGLTTKAKCVNVYDGDTCKVVFPFNGKLTKWTIRVWGVNTPEVRGGSDEDKQKGFDARDFARELILNKIVWVKCYNFGKYGRLVADIYLDEACEEPSLSDMLIEGGHAVEYMRTK